MFSSLPLKWIDFLPCPLLRNSSLSQALEARNIGWPVREKLSIISSALRSRDPSRLSVYVPHHFSSNPGPKKDQWPRGNLRTYSATVCELYSHLSLFPFLCPRNVNVHWHEDDPVYEVLRFTLRRPNVVTPGNIFHSDSVGMPSIRFISLKWLFSEHHLIVLFQVAQSRRRRRLWRWWSDEPLNTTSLSTCTSHFGNRQSLRRWFLFVRWSVFHFRISSVTQ